MNISLENAGAVSSLISVAAIALGGVWVVASLNSDVGNLKNDIAGIRTSIEDTNTALRENTQAIGGKLDFSLGYTSSRVDDALEYTSSRVDYAHQRIDEALLRIPDSESTHQQ